MRKLLPAILSVLALAAVAYPQGLNNNEVEFTGTVVTALDNGDGQGTLFVSIDTVDLRVIVNSSTLISGSGGASLTMAQLAGLVTPTSEVSVEVTGKFSSSGILANQVRVIMTGIGRLQNPRPHHWNQRFDDLAAWYHDRSDGRDQDRVRRGGCAHVESHDRHGGSGRRRHLRGYVDRKDDLGRPERKEERKAEV